MTLGKKIKMIRTEKKITQSQLCDGKITRNMLSEIECDKASPSLATLKFIASRLDVSLPYLLSDDDDPTYFVKKEKIDDAKKLFKEGDFKKCIGLLENLGEDDEINYLLAYCYFEIGRRRVLNGSLKSGYTNLQKSAEFCKKTIYDTSRIENLTLMYTALAMNVQSPLLEFDADLFAKNVDVEADFELFKYLAQDYDYKFNDPIFIKHVRAKELIKERKYREAASLLSEVESLSKGNYNAHIVFSVYCDLENCYKQLMDFENAYRYAGKRLSLIEGFKT